MRASSEWKPTRTDDGPSCLVSFYICSITGNTVAEGVGAGIYNSGTATVVGDQFNNNVPSGSNGAVFDIGGITIIGIIYGNPVPDPNAYASDNRSGKLSAGALPSPKNDSHLFFWVIPQPGTSTLRTEEGTIFMVIGPALMFITESPPTPSAPRSTTSHRSSRTNSWKAPPIPSYGYTDQSRW